jgi:hypothetical protein
MRFRKLLLVLFCMLLVKSSHSGIISFLEMKQMAGANKTYVQETEYPAVIALSFFPELINTEISFQYKQIATTMAARPVPSSLFKHTRSYVIYINSDVSKKGGVSFLELNLKQRVGIIAHELAHILDFEKRNNLSVISCGLLYKCLNTYHRNLERATDEVVIAKGLGNELYAFTDYVLNQSKASEQYIQFKKKNYLLPEEIKQKMK